MPSPGPQRGGSRWLARGSGEYESCRQAIWNRDVPSRSPEFIVRARNESEVIDAVRLARAQRLRVAVRGGGHNWFGSSLRGAGLLIDLSEMRRLVEVDEERREAVVEPAISGQDLVQRLAPHGLSFPVGHCPSVPLGGFLLNGGFGWNALAWGPACFSVRSIDLVTPDGELLTASAGIHPDWFWAARGGSHAFPGVVVRFRVGLFPRPDTISTSTCAFPVDRMREVSDWVSSLRARLPAPVELTMLAGRLPGAITGSKDARSSSVVVTATAFAEGATEARTALAPLSSPPTRTRCQYRAPDEATPYEALFALGSELWPKEHRYRADNFWYAESPAGVLPRVQNLAGVAPGRSFFLCLPLPAPAPGAPALPDAAFSMVGATFVACYAVWERPGEDRVAKSWYADALQALEPRALGHYIGETDLEAHPERAGRSYSPAAWERLQALRRRLDPSGRFFGFYDGT